MQIAGDVYEHGLGKQPSCNLKTWSDLSIAKQTVNFKSNLIRNSDASLPMKLSSEVIVFFYEHHNHDKATSDPNTARARPKVIETFCKPTVDFLNREGDTDKYRREEILTTRATDTCMSCQFYWQTKEYEISHSEDVEQGDSWNQS